MGFLVITRRVGEEIDVKTPDGIELKIHVFKINGKQVRLGVLANDFLIKRGEIGWDEAKQLIKKEKKNENKMPKI